jgi:hypothetical protein
MAEENKKEEEREEARSKHRATMDRLGNLRSDVYSEITGIISGWENDPPSDLDYEREERGSIRDRLRGVQRRIDETIDGL